MPDTKTGSKNNFGFLTRKIGPAPIWLWGLLAVGAYYLYTRHKSGSSSSATDPTQVIDPATGVTYAQEISDAEDQITQLQAQLNTQQQGQTAPQPTTINVTQTETETEPGSGTPAPPSPKPKTGAEKKIPDVAGNEASRALSTVEAAGFEAKTNPVRNPADTYTATGTTPSGQAPEGSMVTVNVRLSKAAPTTKSKARAKPRRRAPTRATVPGRVPKPKGGTVPVAGKAA